MPVPYYHGEVSRVITYHTLPQELSWLPSAVIIMLMVQGILCLAFLLLYHKLNKQSATAA